MPSPTNPRRQEKSRETQQPPAPLAQRRSKSFWTKTRVALALLALAATLALSFATFSRSEKKLPENPVLAAELQPLDGDPFRLADYEGKVLVLNFWATWCGPCKNEVPHLVAMNKEYKSRGVEIVGLSTEEPLTSREKVRNFAREFGMDYKLGFASRDFALRLMQDRTNIPQVFVMRDGRIFNRFIGFNQQTSPQKLRAAIEQALKQ